MQVTIVGHGNRGRALTTRLLTGGHPVALVGWDGPRAAGAILARHGARVVNHYSGWTTRSLVP